MTDAQLLRALAAWIAQRPQTLDLGDIVGERGVAMFRSSSEMREDLIRIAARIDSSSDDERLAARNRELEDRIRRAERVLRGEA